MNAEEEILDLVDAQDNVIGTIARSDAMELDETKQVYIRTSVAFIQNDKGELWIPRRQKTKHIAPGGLDFSMAEHIGTGEDYVEAAVRGFSEELNLSVARNDLEDLGKLLLAPLLQYHCKVFIYHSNYVPNYNPNDFSEYVWLSVNELIKRLEAGEPAKDSLLPVLKKFFT